MHTSIHIHTCTYTNIHIHTYIFTHTHTYTQTHTYTRARTHTHTQVIKSYLRYTLVSSYATYLPPDDFAEVLKRV